MVRIQEKYKNDVVKELTGQFGYRNYYEVPKLHKITINMGLGEALQNQKLLESTVDQIGAVSGQKPVVTRAKKSIANFKIRKGNAIGCMVTLRGIRMFEFFDRFVNVALPRVKDFRGVSNKSFDGKGNFTLGIKEQIIFPEIDYDKLEKIKGLNITIVTTAKTDEEGYALLKALGMPFRKG